MFATGLIMFFEYHVGGGSAPHVFLGTGKSAWVNIHRAAAVLFTAGAAIHMGLHWKYMKSIAKRWTAGLPKKIRTTTFQQLLLSAAAIIVMATGFIAWAALSGKIYQGAELRHHWIDVHNITGLVLLAGLAVHIKRRWRRIFRGRARRPGPDRTGKKTPAGHGARAPGLQRS